MHMHNIQTHTDTINIRCNLLRHAAVWPITNGISYHLRMQASNNGGSPSSIMLPPLQQSPGGGGGGGPALGPSLLTAAGGYTSMGSPSSGAAAAGPVAGAYGQQMQPPTSMLGPDTHIQNPAWPVYRSQPLPQSHAYGSLQAAQQQQQRAGGGGGGGGSVQLPAINGGGGSGGGGVANGFQVRGDKLPWGKQRN